MAGKKLRRLKKKRKMMKKKRLPVGTRSSLSSLSLTGSGNPFNRTKKRKRNPLVSSDSGAFNAYG